MFRVVDLALVDARVLVPRLQDRQGAVAEDALLHGELSRLLLHASKIICRFRIFRRAGH